MIIIIMREVEKRDKCSDLARELKKKQTVEHEGRRETIQTKAFLGIILGRVLETLGDLLSRNLQWEIIG